MIRGKFSLARGIQICPNYFFFILSDHRLCIEKDMHIYSVSRGEYARLLDIVP